MCQILLKESVIVTFVLAWSRAVSVFRRKQKRFAEWSTPYNRPSTKVVFFARIFIWKPCITCTQLMRKLYPNLRQPWLNFFRRVVTQALRGKHQKYFLFFPANHDKEKSQTVYDETRRQRGRAFRKTGCCSDAIFSKNRANFAVRALYEFR